MRTLTLSLTLHLIACGSCLGQHSMVLRDLTLVPDIRITSMEVDGLVLADGRIFSWDQILQGTVGGQHQAEFDRQVREIGLPLYRIRNRLVLKDYGSLQPFADQLASRAEAVADVSDTSYLARCAQFRSQLHQGKRVTAARALLKILALREREPQFSKFDELCRLTFAESGVCHALLPVWFDSAAAATAIAELNKFDGSFNGAGKIYLNSLKIAAGESLDSVIDLATDRSDPWQSIYSAQSSLLAKNYRAVVEQLNPDSHAGATDRHAIALYYSGLALQRLAADDSGGVDDSTWMLTLLQIPANYEQQFPELAAAAIFAVVHHPDNESDPQFDGLRQELSQRYRQTTFGKQHK